jgi:hypothetical protein
MAMDRGEIDAQLREIGEGERWWERREFRDLPHILHAGERIRGLVDGRVLGPRRPRLRPPGTWLLVATDQRLICLRQERFARRQVEVAAGQITRLTQRARLRGYQITMETPQRRLRLRIAREDAFRFAGALAPLLPDRGVIAPSPDLEPLAWLPGVGAVSTLPFLGGIVSRMAMLSPPDYATRDQVERLEDVVESLRGEVERLQQQVGFLEDLLQKRAEAPYLPTSSHADLH